MNPCAMIAIPIAPNTKTSGTDLPTASTVACPLPAMARVGPTMPRDRPIAPQSLRLRRGRADVAWSTDTGIPFWTGVRPGAAARGGAGSAGPGEPEGPDQLGEVAVLGQLELVPPDGDERLDQRGAEDPRHPGGGLQLVDAGLLV